MLRSRRTPYGDTGAAAVEFALLFPIFILLVMGMISAGTAFSKKINITQAARETSRLGATLTFTAAGGSVDSWLSRVSTVGMAAAGPSSDPLGGHDQLCVAYIDIAVPANNRKRVNGGAATTGQCAPPIAALGPRYVQVTLERQTSFFAVVINKQLTLKASSTTPYEPGTSGATP